MTRSGFDPIDLMMRADGLMGVVVWGLVVASALVWLAAVLKLQQWVRWRLAERAFQRDVSLATNWQAIRKVAAAHPQAPGARLVAALDAHDGRPEVLRARAQSALVDEQERASSLLSLLSTVAGAGPLVGLFGTVWGVMEAFFSIGAARSSSLEVIGPAMGDALITTALGLMAAIPAVVFHNALNKRFGDFLEKLEAFAETLVHVPGS